MNTAILSRDFNKTVYVVQLKKKGEVTSYSLGPSSPQPEVTEQS